MTPPAGTGQPPRRELVSAGSGVVRRRRDGEAPASRVRLVVVDEPARRAAARRLSHREVLDRVECEGVEGVALAQGVKPATIRTYVLQARAALREPAPRAVAEPVATTGTRMEPRRGPRREDCLRLAECIGEIAKACAWASGARCPTECSAYEPGRQIEMQVRCAERPGSTY